MSTPRLRWRRQCLWGTGQRGWDLMFGAECMGHVLAIAPPAQPYLTPDRWVWMATVGGQYARGEAALTDGGAEQCKRECRQWVEQRLREEESGGEHGAASGAADGV